jgi:hypothetical protein
MNTHVIGCPRNASSRYSSEDIVSVKTPGRNDGTLDICLVDQQAEDERVCDLDTKLDDDGSVNAAALPPRPEAQWERELVARLSCSRTCHARI